MGKTKTAFVEAEEKALTGEEKYKARLKKKAEAEEKSQEGSKKDEGKVRVPGLKGGQRVVAIQAAPEELPQPTEEEAKKDTKVKARGPRERGKNYQEAKAKVDRNKNYSTKDAIGLLKEISYSKFTGTVELHLIVKNKKLSVNATLPHSFGKEKKVEVANEKTLEALKKGKIDFDVLLATADMMPKLVPFAKLLGPKGLMPNPKNGTIIKSAKDADKFSGNTLNIKTEKGAGVVHTIAGKVDQSDKELEENINAILGAVGRKQIDKAYLKSTMSPSIKLAL